MAGDEGELSADEMDALLRDLETRSGSGGSGKSSTPPPESGDDEDLEAFLQSLEGDDYVAPKEESAPEAATVATKNKKKRGVDERLESLDQAPEGKLQTVDDGAVEAGSGEGDKKSKKKEGPGVVARGESEGLAKTLRALKWLAVVLPVAAFVWVMGAYLSQWVSAGWLVFVMALVVALGVPLAIRMAVQKGRYKWWLAGFALLATVGLTAPIPQATAETLSKWGHWPMSAVTGVAGWDTDHFTVRASAAAASFVAGLLHPAADVLPPPTKLGSSEPLDPDAAPPVTGEVPEGAAGGGEPADDAPAEGEPAEGTPEEGAPAVE